MGVCNIQIQEGSSVISKRPYQIPPKLHRAVETEINKLIELGIITESTSLWASPLVPVVKPDSSICLCVDYRALNSITPPIRYWLPTLQEILHKVGQSQVISKLDLTSGFHQIPMSENSSDLTTFVSPIGKFKYLNMPFGLKNAPATFQQTIEKIIQPVSAFSSTYIDDIIVFSFDWNTHLLHLQQVFDCFRTAGITAKLRKCAFGRAKLKYLGHEIGGGTLAVPQLRVEAMENYVKPHTKRQLRAFLGSVGYYR